MCCCEGLGVGAFPRGVPTGVPPGVDLVEGPLVAEGEGAAACFSATVGDPAAEVDAAKVFVCAGAR